MSAGSQWLPIQYREFHDLPRAIVVSVKGGTYFLDCIFDPALEDYRSIYSVYRVPDELAQRLHEMSWVDLARLSEFLGEIAVSQVEFDRTKRKMMNVGALARLGIAP